MGFASLIKELIITGELLVATCLFSRKKLILTQSSEIVKVKKQTLKLTIKQP